MGWAPEWGGAGDMCRRMRPATNNLSCLITEQCLLVKTCYIKNLNKKTITGGRGGGVQAEMVKDHTFVLINFKPTLRQESS